MKVFITNFLLAILFVFVSSFISCNVETKDQVGFRNQNFIWFVPEGESIGGWVEIDYSRNSELLTSGHCTEFYYNGNERVKYNLDRRGNRDTTFYFDLKNTITHYSVGHEGNMKSYFYEDGKFESFLWDGSIAISGIVENNDLIEYEWKGKMADFCKLMSIKTHVWESFEGFLKGVAVPVKERERSGAKYIPGYQINSLDFLRLNLIDSTESALEILSNFEVLDESINIKESTVQFVDATKLILEEDCDFFLQRLRYEFNSENVKILAVLTQSMLDKSTVADRKDEKIYIEWHRLFKPGDYFLPYLENLDKK